MRSLSVNVIWEIATIAMKKAIGGEMKVVGHVPRNISAICSLFFRRGGMIRCEVKGNRRYSADLPQGGLKIPCVLHFIADNHDECKKAKKLFQSTLSVEVKEAPLTVNVTATKVSPRTVSDNKEPPLINLTEPDAELTTTELPSGMISDNEEAPMINLTESDASTSPVKKKAKNIDLERVVMGEKLNDVEINFAQQLLKAQFPNTNDLLCTLYQEKKVELEENTVQKTFK